MYESVKKKMDEVKTIESNSNIKDSKRLIRFSQVDTQKEPPEDNLKGIRKTRENGTQWDMVNIIEKESTDLESLREKNVELALNLQFVNDESKFLRNESDSYWQYLSDCLKEIDNLSLENYEIRVQNQEQSKINKNKVLQLENEINKGNIEINELKENIKRFKFEAAAYKFKLNLINRKQKSSNENSSQNDCTIF